MEVESQENWEECQHCHKKLPDVGERPDNYTKDVGNMLEATHISCDECHYQRTQDI